MARDPERWEDNLVPRSATIIIITGIRILPIDREEAGSAPPEPGADLRRDELPLPMREEEGLP